MSPDTHRDDHWLVRPSTIRKLWVGAGLVLTLTVLATFAYPLHGSFGFDDWFAFPALFGIASALALLAISKILGFFLSRKDSYYDD